jgi:Ca2+/H+ antiporter, TMEM165/GDT1 family
MNWAHAGTATLAAFLASLVEFVEALTIVLAVGTTRGWRPALIGAAAGALFLIVLTSAFGPALQRVPITSLQLVVGVLLLLFGMRWLRKAILRMAGVIGLHDEAAIYAKEQALLTRNGSASGAIRPRLDRVALAASFKAVTLEGLEVIFIVIATGAGGQLLAAALGALAAGVIVILAGIALHRPLTRVPENALKFAVGVLLSAFGVFWIGEGLQFPWPGEDLALPGLIAAFATVALLTATVTGKGRAARAASLEKKS